MGNEFVTRYDALGMALPNPETMCLGECEGTGWVPVSQYEDDEHYRAAWLAAEKENPSDDGWHFVKCLTCGGTGTR